VKKQKISKIGKLQILFTVLGYFSGIIVLISGVFWIISMTQAVNAGENGNGSAALIGMLFLVIFTGLALMCKNIDEKDKKENAKE
jgi:hypothetical protein